jgi:hypothetical protein
VGDISSQSIIVIGFDGVLSVHIVMFKTLALPASPSDPVSTDIAALRTRNLA